ncbi:coatomer subunit epsilon-like [Zophobas morio]|uniref:coatomer subunit epsilon-like n=1 Tax=Zophobas morio TaxID=2755281 RepID=UPI0030831C4E
MNRALIAQHKYKAVIEENKESHYSSSIKLCSLLARYKQTPKEGRNIIDELEQLLDDTCINDPFCLLLAGELYFLDNNFEKTLKLLHDAESLECMSLKVQCYLSMNCEELAQKELQRMKKLDDDASITQLSTAWFQLYKGGTESAEALYIFQELAEKYGETSLLLNGQAASLLHQGKFVEAEDLLHRALQLDSNDCDVLVNLVVALSHQGNSSNLTSRYMSQVLEDNPYHSFSLLVNEHSRKFDKLASSFS